MTQNDGLKRFDLRFKKKATSLLEKILLLGKLYSDFSHAELSGINILVNSQQNVTEVIEFEDSKTEAFGMCIFGIYEDFLGVMKDQKWSFFHQDAGNGLGKSVRNILDTTFWETLWDALPPNMSRPKFEEAVMVH